MSELNQIYCLCVLALMTSALMPYTRNIQTTTQWLGYHGHQHDCQGFILHEATPLEIQSIYTPRRQNTRNIILLVLIISTFCLGTYLRWYLGATAICLTLIVSLFWKKLLSQKVSYYLKAIIDDMESKKYVFRRNGDYKTAAHIQKLIEYPLNLYLLSQNEGWTVGFIEKELPLRPY